VKLFLYLREKCCWENSRKYRGKRITETAIHLPILLPRILNKLLKPGRFPDLWHPISLPSSCPIAVDEPVTLLMELFMPITVAGTVVDLHHVPS
jgi:hypothetical protein